MTHEEQALQLMDAIDTERKLRGWDYNTLAKRSGLTNACICHVVSKRIRTPNLLTVIKIADALDLSVEVRR